MEVAFKKSQSNVTPELVDTTTSATHVYLRKNVEEKQVTDPTSGDEITVFEYDEAVLTKAEYALYLASMSSDEADTAAQIALAELAEIVDANNTAMQQALAELAEATMAAH